MKTRRFWILLVVIFATMLLAACGAPAAAPTATPIPPTAVPPTDTPIPPTPVPPTPTPNPTPKETVRMPRVGFPHEGFMEIGEISSKALEGNLLGDPTTRRYVVYLPPGYDEESKRYPVLYNMHYFSGQGGDYFELAGGKTGSVDHQW